MVRKVKPNAALTLGIIGTALGAFSGNNGCGCGNNGILGGLFGGNNGNCLAERAMQTAMGSRRDVSESSLEQQSTVLTR